MDQLDGTVDVSDKDVTTRRAVAQCVLRASEEAVAMIRDDGLPKRDPLGTARAAGMLAVKGTPQLIPHCHPIAVTGITIDFAFTKDEVTVRCEVISRDRTGPEVEALCGAAIAALTIYDMAKAVCTGASLTETCLLEKEGGKSGHWRRERDL